jgi:hypothetical protein
MEAWSVLKLRNFQMSGSPFTILAFSRSDQAWELNMLESPGLIRRSPRPESLLDLLHLLPHLLQFIYMTALIAISTTKSISAFVIKT